MAAGLLGLVVACALLLTDRQSAGADTVTLKIERAGLVDPDRWWTLSRIKFIRYGSGSTSDAMLCRRAYGSGENRGLRYEQYYHNTTSVPGLCAYADNGKYWMRFEFDVGPEGDPVPSDIKIVFRQRVAKRVTVSMEYKQCEYVVYSNLPLQRSKRKQEIYIKRNDVLKSGYQTSSDAETCMRLTEGNLSEERRQVAELSSTIERLEEESSNQKHALQAITNERNSLRVNVTSQAQALDNLSAQVATLTWQKNSLTTGLFVSTGVAAVMRLLTTRWSRSVPAIDQNKRQAASKPLLVASLATAAAGFGLGARYASRAEPAPTNDQRLLNSKPLPRLYVAPEYRLPIMAGAVTVALAVLLMTLAVIYDCSSRRRATEHDVFNA